MSPAPAIKGVRCFAGFLPLTSAGELVLVVLLSVSLQEAARYALWKLHRC